MLAALCTVGKRSPRILVVTNLTKYGTPEGFKKRTITSALSNGALAFLCALVHWRAHTAKDDSIRNRTPTSYCWTSTRNFCLWRTEPGFMLDKAELSR